MDNAGRGETNQTIERAARILAGAWGYGSAWDNVENREGKARKWSTKGDESNPAASPGLSICWQTETLERVHHLVNRDWLKRQSTKAQAEAVQWERAQKRSDRHNVSEHEHWQRAAGVAAFPATRPSRAPITALAAAGLTGPHSHLLLLFALEDWTHWPHVLRYARACKPLVDWEAAIKDVMRCVPQSPAGWLLWKWLEYAAFEFLAAQQRWRPVLEIVEAMQPSGAHAYGTQGNGLRSETWWHPEREFSKRQLKVAA